LAPFATILAAAVRDMLIPMAETEVLHDSQVFGMSGTASRTRVLHDVLSPSTAISECSPFPRAGYAVVAVEAPCG
jgi:hypothetical protein